MGKHSKALRGWYDNLHPADRQFKADLSDAADYIDKLEAQLRVARIGLQEIYDKGDVPDEAYADPQGMLDIADTALAEMRKIARRKK